VTSDLETRSSLIDLCTFQILLTRGGVFHLVQLRAVLKVLWHLPVQYTWAQDSSSFRLGESLVADELSACKDGQQHGLECAAQHGNMLEYQYHSVELASFLYPDKRPKTLFVRSTQPMNQPFMAPIEPPENCAFVIG
jgi:hypothetical protein